MALPEGSSLRMRLGVSAVLLLWPPAQRSSVHESLLLLVLWSDSHVL